jgi:uncharacterized cupredoxin-like copper-binding protein
MRHALFPIALAVASVAACGGHAAKDAQASSTNAAATAPVLAIPEWVHVDSAARTVGLDITADKAGTASAFDFNGYSQGEAAVTVPAGYTVTIHFTNNDPAQAHSIGVVSQVGNYPASFTSPTPAFPNAISPDPTSPTGGTAAAGGTATLTFTADQPGQYAIICFMPGHAAAGMWMHFNVSAQNQVGVSTQS